MNADQVREEDDAGNDATVRDAADDHPLRRRPVKFGP
jgi:hypothetical protein